MTDITKARKYLKSRNSDLQHLTSFGLMYNTAKSRYNTVRMQIQTRREDFPGAFSEREIYALLDYAALNYLRTHGVLPPNISNVFTGAPSVEELRQMALAWLNA